MVQMHLLKYFTGLETPRLIIRKMNKSDAPDMYDYACRSGVTKYLLWNPHPSLEYTKSYLASVQKYYRSGGFYDYAMILKKENRMIGTCGFTKLDEHNDAAEIGYVLNPDYGKNGYATEAVRALIRFGMTELGLNRIEARYMTGNSDSRRLMERCGMTFEGIHIEQMSVKGSYVDIGVCAIVKKNYLTLTHAEI